MLPFFALQQEKVTLPTSQRLGDLRLLFVHGLLRLLRGEQSQTGLEQLPFPVTNGGKCRYSSPMDGLGMELNIDIHWGG